MLRGGRLLPQRWNCEAAGTASQSHRCPCGRPGNSNGGPTLLPPLEIRAGRIGAGRGPGRQRPARLGRPGRQGPARLGRPGRPGRAGTCPHTFFGAPPPDNPSALSVWDVVTTSAVRTPLTDTGDQGQDPGDGSRAGLSRSLPVAAVRAAITAAGAGLAAMTILVLVGWIAAPHPGTGLGGVLRTAAVVWL